MKSSSHPGAWSSPQLALIHLAPYPAPPALKPAGSFSSGPAGFQGRTKRAECVRLFIKPLVKLGHPLKRDVVWSNVSWGSWKSRGAVSSLPFLGRLF